MDIGLTCALQALGVFLFTSALWLIVYYVLVLPCAIYLMFFARWGLRGFWLPFAIGPLMEMGPMLLYLMCLNWQHVIASQEAEQNWKSTPDTQTTQTDSSTAASDELSGENGNGYSNSILSAEPENAALNVRSDCESERAPLLGNRQSIDSSANTKVSKIKLLWLLPVFCCVSLLTAVSIVLRIYRPLILPFDYQSENNVTTSISSTSIIHTNSFIRNQHHYKI